MRRLRLLPLPVLCDALVSCSPPDPSGRLAAPNPEARPIDQLALSVNACGPSALLNAFSAGSKPWQRVYSAVPGQTDRDRLAYVIKRYALQPSRHFRDQRRWSRRGGIGAADLADMAAEMAAAGGKLSSIRVESFVDGNGNPQALLRRATLGDGIPLWPWLIAATIIFLLLESLVSIWNPKNSQS